MFELLRSFQQSAAQLLGLDAATRIQKILNRTDLNLHEILTSFAADHPDLLIETTPRFENGAVIYRAQDFTIEIASLSRIKNLDLSRLEESKSKALQAITPYNGGLSIQLIRIEDGKLACVKSAYVHPKQSVHHRRAHDNLHAINALLFELNPTRSVQALHLHNPSQTLNVA